MVRRAPRRPTGTTTRRLTPAKEISLRQATAVPAPRAGVETTTVVGDVETVIDLDHLTTTGEIVTTESGIVRVTETHTREHIERTEELETVDREVKQRTTEFGDRPSQVTPPPGGYPVNGTAYVPVNYPLPNYPVAGDGVTPVERGLPPGQELPSAEERRANRIKRRRWESLQDDKPWATATVLENPPILIAGGLVWAIVMVWLATGIDSMEWKFLFAVLAVAGGAGLCGAAAKTH